MIDQAAVTSLACRRNNCDRKAVTACHVKDVAAAASDHFENGVCIRTDNVERVIALETINGDLLDAIESRWKASAVNRIVRDEEVVSEFRTKHIDRVEAVSTVYVDRLVHHVFDIVRALTAIDVGEWALRIVRICSDEGPLSERVVVGFAEQEQL